MALEIQVTEATCKALRGEFELEERGVVAVKGKGEVRTWLLRGPRDGAARASSPGLSVAPAK